MKPNRTELKQPTHHPRGSAERIELYRLREEAGLPLHVPGDSMDIVPLLHGREPVPRLGRIISDPHVIEFD